MKFKKAVVFILIMFFCNSLFAKDSATLPSNINSKSINKKLDSMLNKPEESKPVLSVDKLELNYSGSDTVLQLNISNRGTGQLRWALAATKDWIIPGTNVGVDSSTLNIMVSRDGLKKGHHSGIIIFKSNGGDHKVVVDMDVLDKKEEPKPAPVVVKEEPKTVVVKDEPKSSPVIEEEPSKVNPVVEDDSSVELVKLDEKSNSADDGAISNISTNDFDNVKIGKWIVADNLEGVTSLNGLHFISSDNGYAVGRSSNSGVIYHWDGSSWDKQDIPNGTYPLYDTYFLDKNNGYAIGDHGTILHFNGKEWEDFNSPTTYAITDISVLSKDNIWCTSNKYIYNWNGKKWKKTTLDVSDIKGLNFTAEDDGYIIDYYGKVLHYNGFGWEDVKKIHNKSIRSAEFSFIDSDNGKLIISDYSNYNYYFNFENGSWQKAIKEYKKNSITSLAENYIWSSGDNGYVYYYDGSTWQNMKTPSKEDLYDLEMLNVKEGWAVGYTGVILRYYVK